MSRTENVFLKCPHSATIQQHNILCFTFVVKW